MANAPALERGLVLLQRLAGLGPSSLERLAQELGWPKSSTLRLLTTLAAVQVVAQASDRRWRALRTLTPLPGAALRQRWSGLLESLTQVGTGELWVAEAAGLRLLDREDRGKGVRARIGWLRPWGELEAASLVALTWGNGPWPAQPWRWRSGKRLLLTRAAVHGLQARARADGQAADPEHNERGVRRWAAPLLDAAGRLEAVAAVASRLHGTGRQADLLGALTRAFSAPGA